MNKRILLGTMTLAIAPIAVASSCSQKPNQTTIETKKEKIESQEIKNSIYGNMAEQFGIKSDGLYIWNKDYKNGELREDNKLTDKELLPLTPSSFSNGILQLGEGDSIYMIYDNDDNDGLSPENFEETVFFEDTSIMHVQEIDKLNKDIGNEVTSYSGFGSSTLVSFNEGKLNTYFGSQSNHISSSEVSFESKLESLRQFYSDNPSVFSIIEKYYETASKAFFPVVFSNSLITYKRLDRAIKITFHNLPEASVTAANFTIKINDNYSPFGRLSIGDENEWNHYDKNGYSFLAHKDSKSTTDINLHDQIAKKQSTGLRLSSLNASIIAKKHAEFVAKLAQWEKDKQDFWNSIMGSYPPTPMFINSLRHTWQPKMDQWEHDHPKPTE